MKQILLSYLDGMAKVGVVDATGISDRIVGNRSPASPWFVALAGGVVAIMIVLGFATRPAALVCAVIAAPILFAFECLPVALVIGQGLSLCGLLLLKPGAVSIDGRLLVVANFSRQVKADCA